MLKARAAAHVHSHWSYDGRWPLGRIASLFRRVGCDVVLMTEHERGFNESRWRLYRDECAAVSRDILVVPGIEYEDAVGDHHVLVWGDLPFLGERLELRVLLDRVRARGGTAVLAHPIRRDTYRVLQSPDSSLLDGFEIWNRRYDGWVPNVLDAFAVAPQSGLMRFVGLDFHTGLNYFPLWMNIRIRGGITTETVYDAMEGRAVEPRAFGADATAFSSGPPRSVLRAADLVRAAARGILSRRH